MGDGVQIDRLLTTVGMWRWTGGQCNALRSIFEGERGIDQLAGTRAFGSSNQEATTAGIKGDGSARCGTSPSLPGVAVQTVRAHDRRSQRRPFGCR